MTNPLKPASLASPKGVREITAVNNYLEMVADSRRTAIDADVASNISSLQRMQSAARPEPELVEANNGKVLNTSG
ncbi:hypothetical protein [Desulfovibrio inopinatus]|uniref:hypothetical protein n=1 Tax=Desulfovibrio inopinatus TaxID=102109 RepID=UPI0004116028|nr:hypothetical protein [Desulfovibrio inopinatus]